MSPDGNEYLVSYGHAGAIGRFRSSVSLTARRGDRVVIRTAAGVEIGAVMCAATTRHAQMLETGAVGELLRLVAPEDLAIAQGEDLGVPMWVWQAARLVFKHAMQKGAAKQDLTTIVQHIERDAGFEIPRTR